MILSLPDRDLGSFTGVFDGNGHTISNANTINLIAGLLDCSEWS